jgi:hypothetical protein
VSSNPVLKPRLATPALVVASAAVSIAAGFFPTSLAAGTLSGAILIVGAVAILSAPVALAGIWLSRFRRRRAWIAAAEQKWHEFDCARRNHGTTTEITVLRCRRSGAHWVLDHHKLEPFRPRSAGMDRSVARADLARICSIDFARPRPSPAGSVVAANILH